MTDDIVAFDASLELDQLTRSKGLFIKGGQRENLGLLKFDKKNSLASPEFGGCDTELASPSESVLLGGFLLRG
jgi:hypothetical protein